MALLIRIMFEFVEVRLTKLVDECQSDCLVLGSFKRGQRNTRRNMINDA